MCSLGQAVGFCAMPGAFPPSPSCDQDQYHTIDHPRNTPTRPQSPTRHLPPRHVIMDHATSDNHYIPTPPRSLTAQRGLKRAADSELYEIQRPHEPQQPATRRVAGMLTTIPHSIWAFSTHVVSGFFGLFRPQQNSTQTQTNQHPHLTPQTTHIEGVATDHTGRKRRAVDVTATPYQPRVSESSSPQMIVARPPVASKAPERIPSSFDRDSEREIARRARWHREYFGANNVDRLVAKSKKQPLAQKPTTFNKSTSIRDRQISGLIEKAHRAQGGSFAQKAAQRAAAEKEAAEKAAAEKAAAEEAARLEEEARIRAEEEAARAQEIIVELPQDIVTELQNRLASTSQDRDTMIQLGSIPIQKLSFKRILASDKGTENWLDDDAVNAWYNAIVDAKKRQTGYVKSDANAPKFANLQTAWWDKAKSKDGPAGLKRWMKRAGVGGANLLKCERLFLPINLGNHWTLLIINGVDQSIEYLDSLGGDGGRYFQIARELLKSELGDKYNSQKWQDLKRNRSCQQNNMSDCGVFTCLNGLAAAKDRPYKEVTAKKMPNARKMMAGVFINGGFEGDFDL